MTKYRVLLSQTAVSQLSLLGEKQTDWIKESLRTLETNPFQRRSGADIKKLVSTNNPPLFRLRTGDYRAIYFVDEHEVKVTEIIHRSKAYKWLE